MKDTLKKIGFISLGVILVVSITIGFIFAMINYKNNVITFENKEVFDITKNTRLGIYTWYDSVLEQTFMSRYEIKEFTFKIYNNSEEINCFVKKSARRITIPNMVSYCHFDLNEGNNITITGLFDNQEVFNIHQIKILS